MRIGFAILLDDKTHNYARTLELELCHKFNLCWGLKQSPHITIKSPFETDKIKPFIKYLDDLAKEITPFEIELDGFGTFGPNTIFLDVKENSHLKKLHFRIIEDLKKKFSIQPNIFEGENVKFHSTLATNDITNEKFIQADEYLKRYHPNFKFKAQKIGVFYYLGEDAGWIVIKKISLSPT